VTTATNKPVTRVTMNAYPARTGVVSGNGFGKERRIYITIGPGDVVTWRWERTRRVYYSTAEWLMRRVINAQLLAEMGDRARAKKRRRA